MVEWDIRHGKILMDFLNQLTDKKIRWFIIRGFEGLPEHNPSKDVDVMVEVGKEKRAYDILKQCFADAGLKYISRDKFGHVHCYIGMNTQEHFSIHIDLIEGYISKGYEVFTFDELYRHIRQYNGLYVLDDLMNSVMLLVYKIFGYHKAKLKEAYRVDIKKGYVKDPVFFSKTLDSLFGAALSQKIIALISSEQFDELIKLEPEITKMLKKYTLKKRPLRTCFYGIEFCTQKILRIVFFYRKHAKTFAVLAPDGAGKTTFLNAVIERMNFYYVNTPEDNRFHIYHFRPSVLPNLGEVGEKAGVMKQDTDFTNPHRSKPANPLSSIVRIAYYTLDYIVGWQKCVRNDVHYDRYTIFDRYSYDLIVDPLRTKLNLPLALRKFFVALTPKPKIVFFLDANSDVIYKRKQELTKEEIQRQIMEYRNLAKANPKRFKVINAVRNPSDMASEAVEILLSQYADIL